MFVFHISVLHRAVDARRPEGLEARTDLSEEVEEGGGGGEEPAREEAGRGGARGQGVEPPAGEALEEGRAAVAAAAVAHRLRGLDGIDGLVRGMDGRVVVSLMIRHDIK